MRATRSAPLPSNPIPDLLFRFSQLILVASLTLLVGMVVFTFGMRVFYFDRAFPGVYAAGLDVRGMTSSEIELALGQALTYPQEGVLLLQDTPPETGLGVRQWVLKPEQIGVIVDAPTMAQDALDIGRRGGLLNRIQEQYRVWIEPVNIPPLLIFDQKTGADFLTTIAVEIDQPVREATLKLTGLEVEVQNGQIGRELDIIANLEALAPYVALMHDADLELVVEEIKPLILDASPGADIAREILKEPLRLTAEGMEPLVLEPPQLAEMLYFSVANGEEGAQFEVGLDSLELIQLLEPRDPELVRSPQNARFIFNDDTRELDLLEPAIVGRALDYQASIQTINQQINQGAHEILLEFEYEEPEVSSSATAEELGISEAVSVVSTYFAGSSPERVQNIKTASGAFHGLLMAPGETLSMAEILGDISLDNGYAEALIIFGDRTIKGVGGGVCQVSTTLFRAAFFGGYQIDERHPHAYRVGYYEQGPGSPGPGFDATVFVPVVDFRFTNDTENWLLLETYVYGNQQLLWKFYSSSDGRVVNWDTSGPQGVVEAPKPLYKENKDLEEGEIEQVDYEADGMDIVVTRSVSLEGETLHSDRFKTHYLPWRAIYEFGPGTDLPDDVDVEED
jgi:vancomycin resistance protein YoaR